MNIVNSGKTYQIYGEDVMTYKALPAKTYVIEYDQMKGPMLIARPDLVVGDEKVYGNCIDKVEKVMQSYKVAANRNFGVLLSGQKGSGKSLFVRMLGEKAIENGMPVIVADKNVPGLSRLISSIEQDCVVVFDEFEKKFRISEDFENAQDDLLSLLDGLDGGHKLFVATCNELNRVSSYMINRPGRFHYHIQIGAPSKEEIEQYMKDNVLPEYHGELDSVVRLASALVMPYDHLRAIAFELNQGLTTKEALEDLNITKSSGMLFNIKAYRADGTEYVAYGETIDLACEKRTGVYVTNYSDDYKKTDRTPIYFLPSLMEITDEGFVITKGISNRYNSDSDDFWDDDDDDDDNENDQETKEKKPNPFVRIVLSGVGGSGNYRWRC